ncbi:hypothetical protein JCM10908_005204 [Rhodotorula pacifica]|uniref:uncharacterized protein n=1 Tax=Rhodotorula pacifica TaxID=1495444 RepID=UPI003178C246
MDSSDGDDTKPPINDPRDDATLPPWLWLTLCTLVLGALLFVSFRRQKSAELYHRARQAIQDRLARLSPFGRGRVQLSDPEAELDRRSARTRPRPRSASQASDQSSLSSSSGRSPFSTPTRGAIGDEEEDDDSSPFPSGGRTWSPSPQFRTRRNYTLDTTPLQPLVSSVLSTLGWTASRATSALSSQGEKADGFARMFWGLRDSERTGGIRLDSSAERDQQEGGETEVAASLAASRARRAEPPPPPGGRAARVLGYAGSSSLPARPRPTTAAAPRFELDDEDGAEDELARTDYRSGEADAVELPAQFTLGSAAGPLHI